MPRYQWSNPHEWLDERAQDWEKDELLFTLLSLASHLDADTLQDLFQSEMDSDGYFQDLDKLPKWPEGKACPNCARTGTVSYDRDNEAFACSGCNLVLEESEEADAEA